MDRKQNRTKKELYISVDDQSVEFNATDFMDTSDAAKLLGLKKGTIELWRYQGKGPEFFKFGKTVRYHKPGLMSWINKQRRTSTSQGTYE